MEDHKKSFVDKKVEDNSSWKNTEKSTYLKSKSQRFGVLSLNRTKDDLRNNPVSTKRSIEITNQDEIHSKKHKLEDTFDGIDISLIMKNNNASNIEVNKTQMDASIKIKENEKCFDAFKNYLNEKENSDNSSQLSQLFESTQVMNQIDSIISAENNVFKVPPPVERRKQSVGKLEDLFTDNNRAEVSHFFDQVEHSINIMGTKTETKNDEIDKVLDAIILPQLDGTATNFPDTQILANFNNSTSQSFLNLSGIDSSFGSALKQVFLANASKDVVHSKSLDKAVVTQKRTEFRNMGPFYGLPLKVKELIKLFKGIEELYEWQDECLKLPAITDRRNLIYALPTSGGKTLVAEILMLREIICYKRNALFILPFVAIVQEKVWALSSFAVALDFLVEEYAASKGCYPPRKRRRKNSIYIATIEKALGLINSLIETERLNEIGLIVVDELHLVGEQGRGATLEALLTKIMHLNVDIQIVGMSATIGNVDDLCKFLNADIYLQNFRPVELKEYVKCGDEIAKINWCKKDEELLTVVRKPDFGYGNDANSIDPDKLGGLVMEVIPNGSCLIFCASKKNCENVAYLLCRVINNKKLAEYKKEEKEQLKQALKDESGSLCKIFNKSIQFGIAYHHSGLTNEERRTIEDGFRAGIISVICCTSTLAAGVNLPAKRVILRQPYVGRDFISLSKYKQMVGRAGRAGLGETGDSILICNPTDLPKVKKLLMSPMDEAISNMHEAEGKGLRHLLLSCISLGTANTRLQLQEVTKKTLLNIQSQRLGVDVKRITDRVISDLFKLGALQEADLAKSENNLSEDVTIRMETSVNNLSLSSILDENEEPAIKKKKKIVVKNNTKLVISKLGCAAIKGNFELTRAHMLYDDLHLAQKSLVLLDCLHLLYLVIPYEISEQIKPNKMDYYNIYTKLGPNEMHTANILGLNDSVALRFLSNQPIKTVSERVLNRFYLALMLYDLWNEVPVFEVSEKYQINRGIVQNLMTSAATFCTNIVSFCEGLEEFWMFAQLLKGMNQRLSHCCLKDLAPLMDLPAVKQNRAKQLYNAGFKTLQAIAKADEDSLVDSIEFLSRRIAKQLIAAAKMLLLARVENLRDEAEDVLDGMESDTPLLNQTNVH